MKTKILVDEETGERFKASPTAHAYWFLHKVKAKETESSEKDLTKEL
jgi:hypothetical protein